MLKGVPEETIVRKKMTKKEVMDKELVVRLNDNKMKLRYLIKILELII